MDQLFEIRNTKQMGRGMFALKQIQVGSRLLLLDPCDYVTYGMIAEHPFFLRTQELQFTQVTQKIIFAFYMAFVQQHKEEQQIYSKRVIEYMENLPKHFNNLICWKQEQLEELDNKELIKKIKDKQNNLRQEYQKVKDFLSSSCEQLIQNYQQSNLASREMNNVQHISQEFNWSDFNLTEDINIGGYQKFCSQIKYWDVIFYYAAIQSRNVYFLNDYDKKSKFGALIPTLQLFNHFPEGQAQMEGYQLKTVKAINENQQIYVIYGQHSPEQLLQNYGFLIDEHFYQIKNEYCIQEPLMKELEQLQSKQQRQIEEYFETEIKIKLERLKLAQKYNRLYEKQ